MQVTKVLDGRTTAVTVAHPISGFQGPCDGFLWQLSVAAGTGGNWSVTVDINIRIDANAPWVNLTTRTVTQASTAAQKDLLVTQQTMAPHEIQVVVSAVSFITTPPAVTMWLGV